MHTALHIIRMKGPYVLAVLALAGIIFLSSIHVLPTQQKSLALEVNSASNPEYRSEQISLDAEDQKLLDNYREISEMLKMRERQLSVQVENFLLPILRNDFEIDCGDRKKRSETLQRPSKG